MEVTEPQPSGSADRPPADRPPADRGLLGITVKMVACKLLSTGAVAAVGIVTARELAPAGRGVLVLLITVASFGLLVSSAGANFSARVHLPSPEARVTSGDYLGLSIALVGVQLLLCIVLGLVLLPMVDVRLTLRELLLFATFGGALLAQYLLNDAFNAYGHTVMATVIEAVGGVLQLGVVVVLAFLGARTVEPFLAALVAANAAQAALAVAGLHRVGVDVRPRRRAAAWRLLVRTGFPGIGSALGQLLSFRIDRYFVGLLMTPGAVGIYSVAATAPEALRLPSLALAQPMLYRLASGGARLAEFRRVRLICIAATMGLAGLTFLVAPAAVRLLFGPEYEAAVTPLRILLLGEAGITIYFLDGGCLAGLNRIPDTALAAIVGLTIVIVADWVLIPAYGLSGAAWASVISYTAMGATAWLLLRRVDSRTARPAPELMHPPPSTVVDSA